MCLQLTFEGKWSRHTHPKDFPANSWRTRFSDIIGASHTIDYRFWNYGEFASAGLKEVAEHGSTRTLESELKDKVCYYDTKILKLINFEFSVRVITYAQLLKPEELLIPM